MTDNPNIPSVEELERAVKRLNTYLYCPNGASAEKHAKDDYHRTIHSSTKALLKLLRAIEDGKYAIVPCEATDEMTLKGLMAFVTEVVKMRPKDMDKLDPESPQYCMQMGAEMQNGTRIDEAYKAAIKAAPTEAIMAELFGGET